MSANLTLEVRKKKWRKVTLSRFCDNPNPLKRSVRPHPFLFLSYKTYWDLSREFMEEALDTTGSGSDRTAELRQKVTEFFRGGVEVSNLILTQISQGNTGAYIRVPSTQ